MIRRTLLAAAIAAAGLATVQPAAAQHLRIGLAEDPDILDPTLARTFVGRIVFAALCDKLFDIDAKLNVVPQLATAFEWTSPTTLTVKLRPGVRFHDGEALDAEAVKYSLQRHLTMQGSFRRSEINSMDRVEVVDPLTVRIVLKEPFAPFVAQLTDRAGMIVSPKAAQAAGAGFGNRPVCAGPFRFVERVAQDRIVVEKFDGYWDAANIHLSRITYQPIPDATVRLANLQAGALDLIERVDTNDVAAVQRNRQLRYTTIASLGYTSITINVGNGPRAETPLGRDARVREALDLAIDREALNQVVNNGLFTITAQAVPPASPYYIAAIPAPKRDLDRARALLREAGVSLPVPVAFTIPNSPVNRQAGEVIQAMAAEAGFDVKLSAMEFASSLQAAQRGEFEAYFIGWSGRTDPDGNLWSFVHSRGAQNDGRYANAEADRLLDAARVETDVEKRRALYEQLDRIILLRDRPRLYLWHPTWIVAHTARLSGWSPNPDGLVRVQGLKLN
ncbi:MAG: ABC transporter substrate-binding protein [Acetobacteraceae bacterium]|nr:ABC transporter substrate-binding protein [Acetobacteraceae bacterium]